MSGHVVPLKVYVGIFLALLALTALTVWVSGHDYGAWNTPFALGIAALKATLVLLYFMHVRYSSRLIWITAAAGLLWLAILIAFTLADFASRGWQSVYG
jgi:cytochrome c oxidase subunit IV